MKTTAHYLSDLSGPEGPDRLFAARVLRARVKRAVVEAAREPDDLAAMEALSLLDELERELPGRCAVAMGQESVVPACADALARLGAIEAAPALRVARAAATRRRTVRAIDRALATLDAAAARLPARPPDPDPAAQTPRPVPAATPAEAP